MLERFIDFVNQQHLFSQEQQVLLAVSGGRDSICMVRLMHDAGYPFAIAHCNFHLRPGDCDRDQAFVSRLADDMGVAFHTVDFDTADFAAANNMGIEEAARVLRYRWFADLCCRQGFAAVATAHHRDDSIETFFLNLFRGTGIAGLHGIRPVSNLTMPDVRLTVVRPLLCFSRADIDRYVDSRAIAYVDDSTNALLDARRNRIRLQLMPLLRELYPSVDDTMVANIERLHDTELLYRQYIDLLRAQYVRPYTSCLPYLPFQMISIDLPALAAGQWPLPTLLFELLRPYGFNSAIVADILAADEGGKLFYSASHEAELHRGRLLVAPKVDPASGRHPLSGDRIRPHKKGGTRLLSDYLKDMGLSRIERRHVLLQVDPDGLVSLV